MSESIYKGTVTFQSEGRLLQELGERLVTSGEVAIVELIKNAYDADATTCKVYTTDDDTLIIEDDGIGINHDDFKSKWMRIASRYKEDALQSTRYNRPLTGAKGIGRFAVRYWGRNLKLESVAFDNNLKAKTQIIVNFDWAKFDESLDMNEVKIHYELFSMPDDVPTGTKLSITNLKDDVDKIYSAKVRTEVLKMVSPASGLDRGWFAPHKNLRDIDPGFNVLLGSDTGEDAISADVLSNYWLRLIIKLKRNELSFNIYSPEQDKPISKHVQEYRSSIKKGVFADIRFFPRRPGIFSGKGFNGHQAWHWIKDNKGIGVIDHGFRVKPYGYTDDDWLHLTSDKARNSRDWRSPIMQDKYPIPQHIKQEPSRNPMLSLPYDMQLIGAVFVESGHLRKDEHSEGLIPAMDRQGFISNDAYRELVDIVRGGLEYLALIDKQEEDRKAFELAEAESMQLRKDFRVAIKEIKEIPSLSPTQKTALIKQYSYLAENIEQVDEYNRHARQNLETLGLLGVLSGFMTHESENILKDLTILIDELKQLMDEYPSIGDTIIEIESSYEAINSQISYSRMFITGIQNASDGSFKVLPQVNRVIKTLRKYIDDVGIKVDVRDISKDLLSPNIPVTLYSGILINLFTNALKAVVAGKEKVRSPKIVISAWNDEKKHIIEVMDNGVGIPPELEKRIWDPLFTTTAMDGDNPLGSGMGLGLSLVKKVISDQKGTINLVEPRPGYSTCFKVELPLK